MLPSGPLHANNKHDIIHKTGRTQHTTMPLQKDQATSRSNINKKKFSSGDMLADRQVHRETNTLITIFNSPNKKSKYVNTHTHNDTVQPSDLCGIVK